MSTIVFDRQGMDHKQSQGALYAIDASYRHGYKRGWGAGMMVGVALSTLTFLAGMWWGLQ